MIYPGITRNCDMKNIITLAGITALLMAAGAFFSCGHRDNEITDDTYGIILNENTAVRIDPMIFAGIVTTLGKGSSVQVVEKSSEKGWVGRLNDYWYKIRVKDGSAGWVFGKNVSLHSSADRVSMDRKVTSFMEGELTRIRQNLAGKWWSTNEFGDFTEHCLELYESGAYRSYLKGGEARQITGTYTVNFNKNEIEFSGGTSFKSNLDLAKRGADYIIKKNMKEYDLHFTKISVETSPEPEIRTHSPARGGTAGNGNTPE